MLDHTEEGDKKCLGLVSGACERFKFSDRSLKIPHIGWNDIQINFEHPVLDKIEDGDQFYFVHSYFVRTPQRELVAGTCNYGVEFDVALTKENLFAVQFHPEKSHTAGLQLLKNFVEWDGKL